MWDWLEIGNSMQTADSRQQTGNRRQETGDSRQQTTGVSGTGRAKDWTSDADREAAPLALHAGGGGVP
jgi:hypothetical protein